MSIEEILKEKYTLENEISRLMEEFENKTENHCLINSFEIGRDHEKGN